jgi:hypothetical protein
MEGGNSYYSGSFTCLFYSTFLDTLFWGLSSSICQISISQIIINPEFLNLSIIYYDNGVQNQSNKLSIYKQINAFDNKSDHSPVTAMDVVEVLIAVSVVWIGEHFVRFTLKAHAVVASGTRHSETTICSDNGHLAVFVRAFTDSVLFHVLLEQSVSTFSSLLTR